MATTEPTDAQSAADTLLGNAPVAFALMRPDGTVLEANRAFASAFGIDVGAATDDLAGRHLRVLTPALWPRLESLVRWVAVTGEAVSDLELSGPVAQSPGVEHHWLVGVYPVRDGELGMLVVDITARKRAEREIRVLARASSLYAQKLSFERALDRAGRLAIPEFADACIVYFPAAEGQGRRVAFVHRDPEVEARLRNLASSMTPLPSPYGAAARAMRSLRAQFSDDPGESTRQRDATSPEHLALLRLLDIRSVITVPLAVGERALGALTLMYTASSDRRYQRGDLELARELGRRTAQLVENLRLSSEAARAHARLDLLARLGELLAVDLDLDTRLHELVRIIVPDLGDAAGMYLAHDGGLELVAVGHHDPERNEVLRRATLPTHNVNDALPPCEAFRTRQPVVVPDVPLNVAVELISGSVAPSDLRAPLRSIMCVPLLGPHGPIGVLAVAATASKRRYEDADVRLAVEIAHRVAPAVAQSQRYEQEREVIEVLQRSLLPAELPKVPGLQIVGRYAPGTEGLRIGGDWYDAQVLVDGTLFLAIGDVVGHGVRAASAMGRLRVALQIYAAERFEPAAMLDRLNRHLGDDPDADMATLAVFLLDPVSGRLRYASAGHPPPALRHADGTVEFLSGPGGPPICATRNPRYTQHEAMVAPGACLALYTDGLVERRGERLDVGLARFAEELGRDFAKPDELADALLAQRDASATDDIAVLVVQLDHELTPLLLEFAARPRELRRMRHSLEQWLSRAGVSDTEIAEITVAANEAAANAMEHAYGPDDADVLVTATITDGDLYLGVRDFGRWRPARATGGGRGLDLMARLMDDVAVNPMAPGTEVCMRRRLGAAR